MEAETFLQGTELVTLYCCQETSLPKQFPKENVYLDLRFVSRGWRSGWQQAQQRQLPSRSGKRK